MIPSFSRSALSRRARGERPLQIVGTINAYHARLAERIGYRAIYLSGGGVAAGSLGLPDLGISTLDDVLTDVRRITDVCSAAAARRRRHGLRRERVQRRAHREIADQVRRGGHAHRGPGRRQALRPPAEQGARLQQEMVDRIKSAADAKTDPDFVVMARTDALAVEGLEAAVDRACACVEAGADMIFPEAITDLAMYRKFADAVKVPILANITEFGKTPLFTLRSSRARTSRWRSIRSRRFAP